jgi:hypothetical protein
MTTTQTSSTKPASPEPSHNMVGSYVVLMETNGQEYESWYNFIRYEGNEKALEHLQKQLEEIDWYIIDDLSTFDLDLEHKVSASTAKEMTKLELNAQMFHRKFDGKLKMIDFGLEKIKKKKDKERMNEAKICRVFDILGYSQIEEYLSDEDVDPEDLVSDSDEDTESQSDSSSEEVVEEKVTPKKPGKKVPEKSVPKILTQSVKSAKSELPGWAKSKKKK